MPSLLLPYRPLSKAALAPGLVASKTQTYTDTTVIPPRGGASAISTSTSSSSGIRTLAWSPLGSLIATADARTLRAWNPERNGVKNSTELKPPLPSSVSTVEGASTAVGGVSVSTGAGISGAATGPAAGRTARPSPAPAHLSGTERVAWNPSKEAELASVGSDGIVRFWDVRNRGGLVGEVKVGGEGFSLAWRPGGEEVVAGRKDDTLIPIDRRTLSMIAQHRQPLQTNQIEFTNSGYELLLTTGDGRVKILEYPSMDILHTLSAHTSSCFCVAPCPRGRHIAIGGSDALITLYDTTNFLCRHSFSEMIGPVRSLSFSFDGSYIVGGSDEGTGLMVAHVETGEYIHTIPTAQPASCVAWHPNRYWLAYSGDPAGLKIVGAAGGPL